MPATPRRVANDVIAATFGCFHRRGRSLRRDIAHRHPGPARRRLPATQRRAPDGRRPGPLPGSEPDRGRRTDGDARRHGTLSAALRTQAAAIGHRGRSAADHHARHGMTRNDDFIGQLESYLDEYEGSTPLPEASATPSAPSFLRHDSARPGGRRGGSPKMNNMAKLGLATAAVVVAALIGYAYLVAPNVGGQGPDEPSPTPTPRPLPVGQDEAGTLDAGTYRLSRVDLVTCDADRPGGLGEHRGNWGGERCGRYGVHRDLAQRQRGGTRLR